MTRDEKLEPGVVVGVKVVAVGGGELSHRDERRKREEVIVQSALAASHFKRQRAVGLDLVDAEFVGADAPVVEARDRWRRCRRTCAANPAQ